jgi:hypothetical protein
MYTGNKARAALENEWKNNDATQITPDSIKTGKLYVSEKNGIENPDFHPDECTNVDQTIY